jgi:hypothetical protein
MMADDYLVMARVMSREWAEYQKKSVWGYNLTGMDNIKAKDAYQAGFMAGFLLKLTKGDEK